jgi:hypothetical protein
MEPLPRRTFKRLKTFCEFSSRIVFLQIALKRLVEKGKCGMSETLIQPLFVKYPEIPLETRILHMCCPHVTMATMFE